MPKPSSVNIATESMTVSQVIARHRLEWDGKGRAKGVPFVRKYVSPATLSKDINELTHEDLEHELACYLEGRPAHQNGNRLKEEFNCLMTFAVKKGYRTAPFHSFGSPQRNSQADRVLSPEEVERVLLETDKRHQGNFRVRIAVRALVLLGLGLVEASEFDLGKVDADKWKYIQADGKGRLRFIPIPRTMRPLLQYLLARPEADQSASSHWIPPLTLQKVVKDIGVQSGVPDLMPSVLTRTAIRGVRPT